MSSRPRLTRSRIIQSRSIHSTWVVTRVPSQRQVSRPVEQALADAIGKRYQQRSCECQDTLNARHLAFTDAMRAVQIGFPYDLDVLALFSEAAITCTPPMLWNLQSGDMRDDAHTAEVVPLLAECLTRLERNGETQAVFRADLGFDDAVPRCCQHADNMWALTGLSQCFQHRDARDELRYIEPHLRRAQARADDNIKSACFCAQASCCSG